MGRGGSVGSKKWGEGTVLAGKNRGALRRTERMENRHTERERRKEGGRKRVSERRKRWIE